MNCLYFSLFFQNTSRLWNSTLALIRSQKSFTNIKLKMRNKRFWPHMELIITDNNCKYILVRSVPCFHKKNTTGHVISSVKKGL